MAEGFPISESGRPNEVLIRPGVIRRRNTGGGEKKKLEPVSATAEYQTYRNSHPEYERGYRGSHEGGEFFEAEILGLPNWEEITRLALKEGIVTERTFSDGKKGHFIKSYFVGGKYVLDQGAVSLCFEIVKSQQGRGNDPENPRYQFPREVRIALMEILGIPNEEGDRVKYYTSVKTPLDYTKGVRADCFFVVDGKILTIDITKKEYKSHGDFDADVVVSEADIMAVHDLVTLNTENPTRAKLAGASFLEEVKKVAELLAKKYKSEG